MTQGIERIPDSLGYLIINDDGAVLSSGGELENDEIFADKIINLVRTAIKIPTADRPANFKRMTVVWESFIYVMTISNHRVFVCKRPYIPQEPVIAYLPRAMATNLPKDKVTALEVQGVDHLMFTSWSGDYSNLSQEVGLDSVEINAWFAAKIGFNEGEEISVTALQSVISCQRLHVEPLTEDDWEILELQAVYVQNHLMDQIRVIWPGQVFPIWVQKSICVYVKAVSIEPLGKCAILEQRTEVMVQPKMRRGFGSPPRPVATKSPPLTAERHGGPDINAEASIVSPDQNSDETIPKEIDFDSSRQPTDENIGHISEIHKQTLSGDDRPDVISNNIEQAVNSSECTSGDERPESDTGAVITAEQSQTRTLLGTVVHYVKSFLFYDDLDPNLTGGHVTTDSTVPEQDDNVLVSELMDVSFDSVLRVFSLDRLSEKNPEKDTEGEQNTGPAICIFQQATTVYISHCTYLKCVRNCSQNAETVPHTFLAKLTRLNSPAEKEELLKKQMEESKVKARTPLQTKKSSKETVDILDGRNNEKPGVIVRVVVLDINGGFVIRKKAGRTMASVDFSKHAQMLLGHVIVPDLLRRQLGLDMTGKVRLSVINHSHMELKKLEIHPLFKPPQGFNTAMLEAAVKMWIQTSTCPQCPLVVSQGTLIKCFLKEGEDGEFLITFPTKTSSSPNSPYGLLYGTDMKMTITEQLTTKNKPPVVARLPFYTTEQLDPQVPKFSINLLGGVSEEAASAVHTLETSLAVRPLAQHFFGSTPGLQAGCMILCGAKGVGKSVLARAVCKELSDWPNYAYVAVVDCKALRGKRIENIRKMWEAVFNECAYRQPSVILLDDLDHVASAVSGPEHISGEALYYARVAEVLKDLVKLEMRQNSRVALIATSQSRSSLHSSLVSSRGNHFFPTILEIQPPKKVERESILNCLLLKKTCLASDCSGGVDILYIAGRTEGYVARDLEMVVDRAIHAHLVLTCKEPTLSEANGEMHLTDEDFRVALDGFTPASLRNVSLHQPGEMEWSDVGGLHDVRQTLLETLQWPSKYPDLFAKCPLRLRSGLLLYGAPGTGKTLLAGVVAKECRLNFISIKGPELLNKYIGASEQAVRDTFSRAQAAKPCVLFFDEFDSLAPRRGHDSTGVTDRVVNQLLTQLDGVEGLDGVYVLAATSRPDLIDPALLRPGRLDKALHCGIPTKDERYDILTALTRKMELAGDVDLKAIADQCEHLTGADFKALLYNAQLESIHASIGDIWGFRSDVKTDPITDPIVTKPEDKPDVTNCGDKSTPCNQDGEQVVAEKPLKETIAYFPNLEEGALELTPEKETSLKTELQSYLNREDGESDSDVRPKTHSTVIQHKHLLTALSSMGPSVSAAERLKYQRIYENFVSSRGGNFGDGLDTAGQRATLA